MSVAVVSRKLRIFEGPTTSQPHVGTIPAGRYDVVEQKEDHPDDRSDYLKLRVAGGEAWICSRWLEQHFATVEPEAPPEPAPLVVSDPGGVPEPALTGLLPAFVPFGYDLKNPRYPYALPGIRVRTTGKKQINCCTFVEALLVRAWEDHLDEAFHWGPTRHAQMMIMDARDRFSPITAVVDAGMGSEVSDVDALPQPWTVVQGWRGADISQGGHTFLVLDTHADSGGVLILEANKAHRVKGVGYRGFGNLSRFQRRGLCPGRSWWQTDTGWTWQRVRSTYPHMATARLHVKDVSFVAGSPDA